MAEAQLARDDTRAQDQLRTLMDKAAISDVICNYATGVDSHDWTLFRSCFTDEIEADFSSLGDMGHFRGSADKWVRMARGLMENLDATQHLMGNIQAEIDGDQAVARCYLQAMHVRAGENGAPHYIIAGHYRHELTRGADGWRIRKYTLTALWTSGNRGLFVSAMERAKAGPK